MATIGTITGSRFIGCPIVVPVTAGTAPGGAVFHRVRLKVEVTMDVAYTPPVKETGVFEFSTPCDNGATASFDISSALRAIADRYEYSVAQDDADGYDTYPEFSYKATAYDDYMVDGELMEGEMASGSSMAENLYVGQLTDRERLKSTSQSVSYPSRYSRKPASSPEVCFAGAGILWPSSLLENGNTVADPAVNIYTYAESGDFHAECNAYVIPFHRDGYELRFINSLGVHESIHVSCLAQQDMEVQTDRYTISRQETLTRFSRSIAVKRNDRERWKMTSGPLDRQWQQWYMHEVLTARWAWLNCAPRAINASGQWEMSGAVWIPVHIIPEETVKGFNRQKASALEVQFTVEFDINGSPM